jgi:hypothetical protein
LAPLFRAFLSLKLSPSTAFSFPVAAVTPSVSSVSPNPVPALNGNQQLNKKPQNIAQLFASNNR